MLSCHVMLCHIMPCHVSGVTLVKPASHVHMSDSESGPEHCSTSSFIMDTTALPGGLSVAAASGGTVVPTTAVSSATAVPGSSSSRTTTWEVFPATIRWARQAVVYHGAAVAHYLQRACIGGRHSLVNNRRFPELLLLPQYGLLFQKLCW